MALGASGFCRPTRHICCRSFTFQSWNVGQRSWWYESRLCEAVGSLLAPAYVSAQPSPVYSRTRGIPVGFEGQEVSGFSEWYWGERARLWISRDPSGGCSPVRQADSRLQSLLS